LTTRRARRDDPVVLRYRLGWLTLALFVVGLATRTYALVDVALAVAAASVVVGACTALGRLALRAVRC
jgi:hypothetical protein